MRPPASTLSRKRYIAGRRCFAASSAIRTRPCEQLREPHLAAVGGGLEDVVPLEDAAQGECPALGGDLLVHPPKLALRLQQLVACAAVFARLAGELDVRVEE